MDTPENIETLQYMVDMQQKTNVMPTEEQMAGMGDWDLFESGRLGMIVTGIWAFPEYTNNCDFDWDIVVEPGHTQKAQIPVTIMPPTVKQRRSAWTQAGSCLRFRTRISSLSTKKRLLRQIAKQSLRALIIL